jgi:hypothetical protein
LLLQAIKEVENSRAIPRNCFMIYFLRSGKIVVFKISGSGNV